MANEISYFNSFIAQRYNSIPYSTQWMMHVNIPLSITSNLRNIDTEMWNINYGQQAILNSVGAGTNHVHGNIFAQSVTVPGEKLEVTRVGIESGFRGGFNTTPIINSRADPETVNISFLETTYSFLDLVIRPWIIQVGHQGLVPISDDPKDSIKSTMWVMFFDRGDIKTNTPPKIRKMWKFNNVFPISCDSDTTDFQKNQITTLATQWMYTHYTIDSVN